MNTVSGRKKTGLTSVYIIYFVLLFLALWSCRYESVDRGLFVVAGRSPGRLEQRLVSFCVRKRSTIFVDILFVLFIYYR